MLSYFRESRLISSNAIVTLGYIGVHLRYIQDQNVVDSVVQIFQQRFCSPPSGLDTLIVDQLVAIVAAGCVSVSLAVMAHVFIYNLTRVI